LYTDNYHSLDKLICRNYSLLMVGPGTEVISQPKAATAALHETRRTLLVALVEPQSAAGLGRQLGLPRQRLNYHLRELERCGLIALVEERRKGNCTERILQATARSFVISPTALGTLGPTPDAATDRFSASYVVALAARAIHEVGALETRARAENKRLATLALDAEIRFATADARAAFADELSECVARLVAKYHDDHSPAGRRHRLTALVHPLAEAPATTDAPPSHAPGHRPKQAAARRRKE
jgi:DNA-binding transcriptional ArsR family regulator